MGKFLNIAGIFLILADIVLALWVGHDESIKVEEIPPYVIVEVLILFLGVELLSRDSKKS